MQIFHSIASLIILCAAFLAFFASIIFLRIKTGNLKANRFLSLFCFSTAIYLTRGLLLLNGILIQSPLLNEFMDNTRFFLGPILYFYIKSIIDPDSRFKWSGVVHLAPVMLNLIVRSPFYFNHDDYQIHYLANWLNGPLAPKKSPLNYLSQAIFFGSFWFYIGHAILFHWKSKKAILKSSCFGPFYFSWFRIFTYALALSMVPWLIGIVIVLSGYSIRYPFYSMNLLISLVVFFCVMKIFSWPEILFMAKPLKSCKKYDASYLTDHEAGHFLNKIKSLMEQEQSYLDPDLDLSALAAKLSIPKNYLSQIINEKAGKSFNDFINHYRTEKIKALFRDPARQNETILSLALEAGFNSKASFNNVFKKFTGELPADYRKRHLQPGVSPKQSKSVPKAHAVRQA